MPGGSSQWFDECQIPLARGEHIDGILLGGTIMTATTRSVLPARNAERRDGTGAEPGSVVHELAGQMQVPIDVVVEIYEFEFARLAADARVTAYVSILAVKRVREALRQRGAPRRGITQVDDRLPAKLTARPPTRAASGKQATFPGCTSMGAGHSLKPFMAKGWLR
jgi:hypothetical protein